jgi:small GTP-binding protein
MAETDSPPVKVTIMGESGVGKTSLVTRWARDTFHSGQMPSIGPARESTTVHVSGRTIRVALWDTVGQEWFRGINQLMLRDADCGVFVAAGNDEDSFLKLDRRVSDFYEVNEKTCPIVLAVNKLDISEKWHLTPIVIAERYQAKFASVFFVSAFSSADVRETLEYVATIADEYRVTKPLVKKVDFDAQKMPEMKDGCTC